MLDFIRKNNNNNLYKLENFFYLDLEIKKLLIRYNYPSNKSEKAVQTVIRQAELKSKM